ncbi:hypothetical protein GPL10_23425 [Bacteroides fragilis]|nr:hypothetical protein [Bacteroides fragilis]
MIYNRLTISTLLVTRRFKRRSSDATKIRCFFYLRKSFCIVLIISHLSIPFAFCTESKNPVSKDERFLKHNSRSICLIYTNLPQNKSCIHSLP